MPVVNTADGPNLWVNAVLRFHGVGGIIGCAHRRRLATWRITWGRVGSTGAVSDGLQAEVAAALAKNGGEQVTGEREFALAA